MANDTADATANWPSIDDLCPLLAAATFTHRVFPLMELPPELRLRIYRFAIHDTIDGILARPRGSKPVRSSSNWQEEWDGCPRFLGSLALLHTSREVRSEVKRDFRNIVDSQYGDMRAESRSLLEMWIADEFDSNSYVANYQAYIEAERDVGVMRIAYWLLEHANGYWPTVDYSCIPLNKAVRSRELFRSIPSKQSFRGSPSARGPSVFCSRLEAASDNLNLSENAFRLSDYQDTHDEDNPGNTAGQISSDRDQSSLKRGSPSLGSKIDTNTATMTRVKHSSIDKKSSNLSKSAEWKERTHLWKLRQQLRPGREQLKTSTVSELNPAGSSLEVYARRTTVKLNKSDDWKERRHLWKLRQRLRPGLVQLDQQAITSSPFTLQIDNKQRVAGKKRKADAGAASAHKKTKTTPNDATSANEQQVFLLMDLPSDLRIRIYQHAVHGLVDTVTSTT